MADILRFELHHQLRSPLFAIVAVVFFLLGFLVTASEAVQMGGGLDNLNINAAYAILQVQYTLSIIGMFAAVAFVAGAVTRDFDLRTAEIFFASGVGERPYLAGRFVGGWIAATLAVGMGIAGALCGTFMPWLDPERVGNFAAAPYLFSVWAVLIPNTFVVCALFFAVAALTRSMMAAYVAALGFMIAFAVLTTVTDFERTAWLALADPFGIAAFEEITRYWTVFERNERVPAFAGTLLYNRLVWIAVAVFALAATLLRFRFTLGRGPRRRLLRRRRVRLQAPPAVPRALPVIAPSSGLKMDAGRLLSQLRMDVRGIVRSVPFYVLLAFGVFNVVGAFIGALSQLFGTPVLPVTPVMIRVIDGAFLFVVVIIILYYSGELVHRERQHRVAGILDATPYPSGIMVLAKIGALWVVITALLAVVMVTSIVVQALNGYYRFELGLYLTGLFGVLGYYFYLWCVPAVLVQVLSPSKFVGMLMFLMVFLALQTLPGFGFEHHLYLFSGPRAPYSAMNGWGHFVEPMVVFGSYWFAFTVLLLVLAHLLFPRGAVAGWRERLRVARQRFVPGLAATSALAGLVFAGLGGWIFYNTNVLNEYRTEEGQERAQAEYEKRYKQFATLPQPEVVDLDVTVEMFPDERRLESRGSAELTNTREQPLERLHLTVADHLDIETLSFPGAELEQADEALGYYRYRLSDPLEPGESATLRWDLVWANPGFENSGSTTRLVYNGTFVDTTEIMPVPGYDSSRELVDNNVRREYDLPPVQRLPKLGDRDWLGLSQFQVSRRSGFRATIGTAADQVAVAPGYLEREWTENGRRYFQYAMDAPIWPFVSFSSARYEVTRDTWNGVALEVFHHPEHDYNVEAMLHASRRSLDYFNREFSPYQYRQFRILEFPGYERFAQAFPNTIPYSEDIGFVADLRKEDHIDYVFYVTAHELAHQWWGHQVVGANMQGMTMIVETLAQYSALMVQEQEFGAHQMRRFLKYELDNYLRSRGGELIEELPLMYVENQGYVHYRKGSLVMYALRDYIGEEAINRALRRFIDRHAFEGPPFPTSRDLVELFRAEAGPEHQQLITDLFEKIVLFDLAVVDARSRPAPQGGYEVTLTVEAAKLEADGSGRETEVPLDYRLDVGVFPAPQDDAAQGEDLPPPLVLEKQRVVSGTNEFSFHVAERPDRVGIDPYNKMIDRNPGDNLRGL